MDSRDKKLQTTKQTVKKTIQKDLKADRKELQKRERELLLQLRTLEKNGEHYKARLVARQIAQYRAVGDRNFEAETLIVTRAQTMASDHKVNRCEIDAIKGIKYANSGQTLESTALRSTKYSTRMEAFQEMESIMNEGMDEIYDDAEETRPKYQFVDNEVDSIIRQAFTGKKDFSYDRKPASTPSSQVSIRFKRLNEERDQSTSTLNVQTDEVILPVASLDYSIDMLKHEILQNELAIASLGVKTDRKGRIVTSIKSNITFGKVVNQWSNEELNQDAICHFIPFYDSRLSLRQHGIANHDLIHLVIEDKVSPSKK